MVDVAIFIGSISDKEKMFPCIEVLEKLGISYKFHITSAHRTPNRTENLIKDLEEKGCKVFICAAGLAAHLAGAVAARTTRPVIGVPINASSLGGIDALLSTVQMPPGYPVATVALDRVGAQNAAYLAAQILAVSDFQLEKRLKEIREEMARFVEESDKKL
ncbi:5-(carboxyamino)imidazole ribonucleotide mutase [Desulfothermus okinawensis JCM 13304]